MVAYPIYHIRNTYYTTQDLTLSPIKSDIDFERRKASMYLCTSSTIITQTSQVGHEIDRTSYNATTMNIVYNNESTDPPSTHYPISLLLFLFINFPDLRASK
jgi:hypothetical protein